MQSNVMSSFRAGFVFLLLVGTSMAGPLPTDPAAISGWQGTSVFSGKNGLGTINLKASVEFAVYAPGDFKNSAALDTPPINLPGYSDTEFVYAYEIFGDPTSDSVVTSYSVNLIPGTVTLASTNVGNYSFDPEFGLAPVLNQFIHGGGVTTNARWTFGSPWVAQGAHSDILFFTSPFGPTFRPSSMTGSNSTGASAAVPSPVPEPGTAILAAVAVVCIAASRFLRRRPK